MSCDEIEKKANLAMVAALVGALIAIYLVFGCLPW